VTTDDARFHLATTERLARFETLYDAHRRQAYGLALSILRDASEAEDAVQDAFLSAWRAGIPMDPESVAARRWVLRIVRNRAIDLQRRRVRRTAVRLTNESDVPLDAPDVSQLAAQAIDAEVVSGCMSSLPSEQRDVLELAYFAGLTHGEIAERSRLPLGTVKSRIRLALDRLRAMVDARKHPPLSA
jgi:RNA polymerase sigma-70 factor (ECF subfamily)